MILVAEWEGETLEMSRISRLDMGAYLCIASNGIPPTVSKQIKVSVDCKYILYLIFMKIIYRHAIFFWQESWQENISSL